MKKKETRAEVVAAYILARKAADRVLDRFAMRPMRSAWDINRANMVQLLKQHFRGMSRHEATPVLIDRASKLVASGLVGMGSNLAAALAATTRDTVTESVRMTEKTLGVILPSDSPLDDPASIQTLTSRVTDEHARLRLNSTATLRDELIVGVAASLEAVRIDPDAKVRDIIDAVDDESEEQWWRAERLVRTETSFSYNAAAGALIGMIAAGGPGLHMRWTELVSDLDGRPFDAKVGRDSLAMHGQVVRAGGQFTQPTDDPRSGALAGRSFSHPPNRPNDRAVLVPWMPGLGVPAYAIQAGNRIGIE